MAALDRWERRLAFIAHGIPYFVLTVTTVMYSIFTVHSASERWVTYGVVAFGYAWMAWWFTLHPAWHSRAELMAVFVGGMVVFYGVLGLREQVFGAVSYAVYIYASELLRGRWMFFVVALTAVLATLSLFGGYPPAAERPAFWLLALVFVVLACTFTFVGHVTTEQSRLRKELLEENEGLHAQLLVQAHEAGVQDERGAVAWSSVSAAATPPVTARPTGAPHGAADPARAWHCALRENTQGRPSTLWGSTPTGSHPVK